MKVCLELFNQQLSWASYFNLQFVNIRILSPNSLGFSMPQLRVNWKFQIIKIVAFEIYLLKFIYLKWQLHPKCHKVLRNSKFTHLLPLTGSNFILSVILTWKFSQYSRSYSLLRSAQTHFKISEKKRLWLWIWSSADGGIYSQCNMN